MSHNSNMLDTKQDRQDKPTEANSGTVFKALQASTTCRAIAYLTLGFSSALHASLVIPKHDPAEMFGRTNTEASDKAQVIDPKEQAKKNVDLNLDRFHEIHELVQDQIKKLDLTYSGKAEDDILKIQEALKKDPEFAQKLTNLPSGKVPAAEEAVLLYAACLVENSARIGIENFGLEVISDPAGKLGLRLFNPLYNPRNDLKNEIAIKFDGTNAKPALPNEAELPGGVGTRMLINRDGDKTKYHAPSVFHDYGPADLTAGE